jgi:hypothetical protein
VRNLFLALLFANLAFLGWRLWVAPAEVAPDRLLSRGKEPDLAASAPAVTKGGGGAGPTARTEAYRCLRIGPIADGQVADTLHSSMISRDIKVDLNTEEGQIWVGHWVQLESVATRQEADVIAARLTAGGLPDAYVLQTAPPFSISLGVFRDRARADNIVAQATRLGFRPQISDRYRAGLQYWLAAEVPAGSSLPLEELGRQTGQILRAEPVTCKAAADE